MFYSLFMWVFFKEQNEMVRLGSVIMLFLWLDSFLVSAIDFGSSIIIRYRFLRREYYVI